MKAYGRASGGLLVIAVLATSGCGGAKGNGQHQDGGGGYQENGTYTRATAYDTMPTDPYRNYNAGPTNFLYDSLINVNSRGEVVSGIATKWDATATEAKFTLNSAVTCSDGTKLTATMVAEGLNWVKDPKNKSPLAGLYLPADPFTVTADDAAGTVKVSLTKPYGFLTRQIGRVPIVCPKGLQNPDGLKSTSQGTGPFVLESVEPGKSYTLVRRDGYTWGPNGARTDAPGTPQRIVTKVIKNETTAANLLQSGQVNSAMITGPDRARVEALKGGRVDDKVSESTMWFNERENRPGADEKVRRALTGVLDLDELMRVATGGSGARPKSLVTGEGAACQGDVVSGQFSSLDLAAAGRLLDEAGWRVGAGGTRTKNGKALELDLRYYSVIPGHAATAELMAPKWGKLGVKVNLTGEGDTAFDKTLYQTGDFDVYLIPPNASIPNGIEPFVSGELPPSGQNFAAIRNAEYDRLAAEAAATPGDQGCELWHRAEKSLYQRVDVVPIADTVLSTYLNKVETPKDGWFIPTAIRLLK